MSTRSVYEELREEIMSGARLPGSTLVENDLAAHFGVSRTPIREALFKLRQDGLVERTGRSVTVRSMSPELIMETYEVRLNLEGLVARMAAQRRTDVDLVRIRAAYTALQQAEATDRNETRETLTFLRGSIWAASHNSILIDVLNYVYTHVPHFIESTLQVSGRWEQITREYGELIAAIADQRPAAAEEITVAQINAMIKARLEFLAKNTS